MIGISSGQENVVLNGTSGSDSSNANYSTNGGLNISLNFLAEYLVIGGGGSGGTPGGSVGQNTWGAGGGGAGGFLTGNMVLTNTSYGVSVGAGGVAPSYGSNFTNRGANGGNSTFADVTALGGGGGGGGENSFSGVGASGGSGGGGGSKYSNAGGSGTSGQGFGGGNARNGDTSSAGDRTAGGGGGGAGGAGSTPASGSSIAGNGGAGLASSISGTSVTYAGGGGGGARDLYGGQAAGSGGSGGGGAGSIQGAATSGIDGLGGGGGGAGADGKGGDGGDGIVIVRYKGNAAGTGGSVTTGSGAATGYTIHTFTNTGSSSLNLSGLNLNTRLGAVQNGVISGSGDLNFSGPGTLTLNATNTYSGVTRVNSGTLSIGSGGSIGNSTAIRVANGANFNVASASGGFILGATQNLSGGGTITGDVTIAGSHTPGFSPGLQSFTDNLTYSAGSSITWELTSNTLSGRGTNFDGIDVAGDLNFAGNTSLVLDFNLAESLVSWSGSLWESDVTGTAGWKIFGVQGDITGFENLSLTTINWQDSNNQTLSSLRPNASFSLYQGNDGIYLNYSAVPESSTALIISLAGGLSLLRRRRMRA
ncbi:MAG: glycine-rich domain-containing protein [Akkermansiaceae bacterium]